MVLSEIESFRNFRKSLLKTLWWIILTLTVEKQNIDQGKIVKNLELNYFVTSDTKIDERFLTQEFVINNFEIKATKDRDCREGDRIY